MAEAGPQIFRVLISDPLAESGLRILREQPDIDVTNAPNLTYEELVECIGDYDALLIRSRTRVDATVIEAARRLKVIGRAGVGVDNVDLDAATRRGIIVMNSPTGNTISAAEHTMTMILALSRNIAQANALLRSGKWDRSPFVGVELYGKTLGIVGLGRVGTEVAKRARAFGMQLIAEDPYISHAAAERIGVELVSPEELLARSDYLTVHIPLTRETYHKFGPEEFAKMKPGIRIINCARGGIYDEEALYEALKSGHVAGAALDVFEDEPNVNLRLIELPNVLATPHLGASTAEAQENISIDIATQVLNALRGKPVQHALNLPSIDARTLEMLGPYLSLAEKLGSLHAQLIGDGAIEEVRIEYSGGLFEKHVSPITTALQKGLLSPVLEEAVNYVNAPFFINQRGIRVTELRTSSHDVYTNLLTVTVRTGSSSRTISGTVFGTAQRIVMIDNYHCTATPEGAMLIVFNDDQPGTIGIIGTILGQHGLNIADMSVGREKRGGRAVMLINLDMVAPREVVDELAAQPGINEVYYVVLPD